MQGANVTIEVTGISPGKATISITMTESNVSKSVEVTVVEKSSETTFTIVAEVENGNSYNNLISKVVAYGWVEAEDDDIEIATGNYANGGFTMTLPTPLNSKFLENIMDSELGEWGDGDFTYSDVNAKICIIHKAGFEGYSSSGTNVGYFFYGSYYDPEVWVLYIYADRSVTISGSDDYTILNVSLKQGWNIVYVSYDEDDICTVSSEMPTVFVGMKWKFYAD